MPTFKYTAGLNNVGSYQVSGMPYATGSLGTPRGREMLVEFPYVTKWVQIVNNNASAQPMKVAFSKRGLLGKNFFTVPVSATGSIPIYEMKVTQLWFSGSNNFDVVAGLTNVRRERVNNTTIASGGAGSQTDPHAQFLRDDYKNFTGSYHGL
tara:strand:- start:602 stop:1057 length:456 start_codon:yes stop_codon:yes gene_type:complete